MDTQYLKSQAILLRRQQAREWKEKAGAEMKIRVTKCYLVQVLDEDGNEQACEYVFANTKKEAEARGRELQRETEEE